MRFYLPHKLLPAISGITNYILPKSTRPIFIHQEKHEPKSAQPCVNMKAPEISVLLPISSPPIIKFLIYSTTGESCIRSNTTLGLDNDKYTYGEAEGSSY